MKRAKSSAGHSFSNLFPNPRGKKCRGPSRPRWLASQPLPTKYRFFTAMAANGGLYGMHSDWMTLTVASPFWQWDRILLNGAKLRSAYCVLSDWPALAK